MRLAGEADVLECTRGMRRTSVQMSEQATNIREVQCVDVKTVDYAGIHAWKKPWDRIKGKEMMRVWATVLAANNTELKHHFAEERWTEFLDAIVALEDKGKEEGRYFVEAMHQWSLRRAV